MLRRAVAFVAVKPVLRIAFRQFIHFRITRGFGQNRSGGNLDDFAVAFDHGFGRDIQIFRHAVAVYPHFIGSDRQPLDCALHRGHGCVQDVQLQDFVGVGKGNVPRNRLFLNHLRQHIALFFAQFF